MRGVCVLLGEYYNDKHVALRESTPKKKKTHAN